MSPSKKMYTYSLEKVDYGGDFAMFASDFDGDGICDMALSKFINGEHAIRVYSKFVYCSIEQINQYQYLWGYNPLSSATVSGIRTRSQYLHVGNFYNKDNMSFLGNEVPESDRVQQKKPVLCSLYSLHEYNSVTCVTDGLGNETRMSYRYPAIAGMRRIELGNGICSINMPVRTLHSVTEYKIHDVAYTTYYSFGNALLHQDGHGYLGFQRQETLEKVNDIPVSKNVTNFETRTMGSHAFSLPENETAQVYVDGGWRTLMERGYGFRKVTCTRNQKVVKPAVIELSSIYYNFDTPNPNDLCVGKSSTMTTVSGRVIPTTTPTTAQRRARELMRTKSPVTANASSKPWKPWNSTAMIMSLGPSTVLTVKSLPRNVTASRT